MATSLATARESLRDPLGTLHREVNRVFDEVFRGFPSFRSGIAEPAFAPSLEVRENETEIQVSAELPGMDEKNIDLKLAGGRLIIRGEKKDEREEKTGETYLRERRFGSFERVFTLPDDVDAGRIEARFDNGILKVSLPRKPEAKRSEKKIEIKKN